MTRQEENWNERDRCRAARLIIRLGHDDRDREVLLNAAGLTWDDASPGPACEVPPPLSEAVELSDITPVVVSRSTVRFLPGERECSACGQMKPASEFYTGRAKCKACHQQTNSKAQQHRRAGRMRPATAPERRVGRPRKPRYGGRAKECSRCHEVKLLSEFVTDKRTPDGRGSNCRDCFNKARQARKAVSA